MYDYLIVYILGIFTPLIISKLLLPLIIRWAKNQTEKGSISSIGSIFDFKKKKKREGCEECGSSGRHRKKCSRGKKK
jgi:hypothetical protein